MIGALIILLPPLLAIYAMYMRIRNKEQGQIGFVYNGKIWVTWIALIAVLGGLFMIFGSPIIEKMGFDGYKPDWKYIRIIILALIEYISYVLVAHHPATAEEIEEAKYRDRVRLK